MLLWFDTSVGAGGEGDGMAAAPGGSRAKPVQVLSLNAPSSHPESTLRGKAHSYPSMWVSRATPYTCFSAA